MVDQLGLETEIRPQRRDLDNYRDPAGMVPVEKTHPAFSRLPAEDGVVWLSQGGCRAVADFYWGGPAEGMLLAKSLSQNRAGDLRSAVSAGSETRASARRGQRPAPSARRGQRPAPSAVLG